MQPSETAGNLPDITGAEEELDWKRAHPLSPLVRVWLLFLAICFFIGREFFEGFSQNGFSLAPADGRGSAGIVSVLGPFALPVLVLSFFLIALIPHAWSWYNTRYAIDESKVYLRRGAVFRTSTEARLDKVQAIDIYQPFVARFLGLAELKFEVADGSSTLLAVRFLKKRDADTLRELLLRQVQELKQPSSTDAVIPTEIPETAPAVGAEEAAVPRGENQGELINQNPLVDTAEQLIVKVPVGRNILAVMLGSALLPLLIFAAGFALLSLILGGEVNLGSVLGSAGILGVLATIWGRLNSGHRFRIIRVGQSLKLRYGLTSTTSQTVPLGRIQAISVTQPFFWRFLGWFRVTATIAGYDTASAENSASQRNVLLPVGTGQDLLNLVPHLVKNQEQGRIDGQQLRAALEGRDDHFGFVPNPRVTRWVNWFTYRRNGFAQTPAYLLLRGGFFVHRLRLVPLDKVQSVQIIEGPLDRKMGIAQVDMGMVSSNLLDYRIENVSADKARYLARLLTQVEENHD